MIMKNWWKDTLRKVGLWLAGFEQVDVIPPGGYYGRDGRQLMVGVRNYTRHQINLQVPVYDTIVRGKLFVILEVKEATDGE